MAAVRTALGEEAFEAATATGRNMTLDEAIACALEGAEDNVDKKVDTDMAAEYP